MVVMGAVAGAWGIRGWVRIRSWTAESEALLHYPAWWMRSPHSQAWKERRVLAGKMHAGEVVALLDGVSGREAAQALARWEIAVPRAALPATGPNEVYLADLVGMAVVNRAGVALGNVVGVAESGAHPLLRVVPEAPARGPERLIPFTPPIVAGWDAIAGRIEVDWGEDY